LPAVEKWGRPEFDETSTGPGLARFAPAGRQKRHCTGGDFLVCWGRIERAAAEARAIFPRFAAVTVFPTRTMFLNVIQGGIIMEGGA